MSETRYRLIPSHTGPFAIVVHPDGSLTTTWLGTGERRDGWIEDRRLMPELARRMARFFKGEDVDFSDVPLPAGSGGASGAFFRKCWAACRAIPRGRTLSYAELAVKAGASRSAARAAGQAMRCNPMPIITPCHRVIGSTGRLHGFSGSVDAAGGPLAIKRALLEMEGALPSPQADGPRELGNRSHGRGASTQQRMTGHGRRVRPRSTVAVLGGRER